jgi:hypothetical protein
LLAATQAVADTETSSSWLDFKTALLVVVTVALFTVTRKLVSLHRRIEALESAPPFPANTPPNANNGHIPPETVAAISAAVHTTLRGRLRILAIGEPCPKRQAWSVEGRRQVFSSHNVR